MHSNVKFNEFIGNSKLLSRITDNSLIAIKDSCTECFLAILYLTFSRNFLKSYEMSVNKYLVLENIESLDVAIYMTQNNNQSKSIPFS